MDDDFLLEKDVEEARKRASLLRDYQIADFGSTVSTPSGRAVIWRILEFCGVHRASFTGDAEHTFWREGMRKVGQEIYLMFDELPNGDELMVRMTAEARKRNKDLLKHD